MTLAEKNIVLKISLYKSIFFIIKTMCLITHTHTHIYMCVCVCVCVLAGACVFVCIGSVNVNFLPTHVYFLHGII